MPGLAFPDQHKLLLATVFRRRFTATQADQTVSHPFLIDRVSRKRDTSLSIAI